MAIRLIFRLRSKPEDAPWMFRSSFAPASRPWLPLLGSVAAHAVLLVGLPVLSSQLAQYVSDDFDWSAYRVEPMKIRIPERIYYAHEQESRASKARSAARTRPGSTRSSRVSPQSTRQPRYAVAKAIEFPPLETSDSETAILQPNTSRLSSPVKLPPLAFWARRDPLAPKATRDGITLPGRVEQPGPAPKLASVPSAAVPNRETNAGDRNRAAVAGASSSLAVPSSSTAPIREQTPEAKAGVLDWIAGQAANLIVVSSNPYRPGAVADVPAGSRDGRVPAGDHQAVGVSEVASDASPANSGGMPNDVTSPGRQGPSKSSSAAVRVPGSPHGNSTQLASGSQLASEVEMKAASVSGGAEAFTRIMNSPDGNFDVVVTQAGDHADGSGRASGLAGSPVYSVYLRVGDEREWMLEFCLPKAQQPRNSRYEVHVGASDPVSAPYPVTTTIPNSIIGLPRPTPLAFHGFITAAGVFRDIAPRHLDSASQRIAAVLDQWRFRPAKRDNLPVDVEVLLILPATKDRASSANSARAQTSGPAAAGAW